MSKTIIKIRHLDLWIGKFRHGGFAVYDPEMQNNSPFVFLFSTDSGKMHFYGKNWIRRELTKVNNPKVIDFFIRCYLKWKCDEGYTIIPMNLETRLDKLTTNVNLRITGCWHCKRGIEGENINVCLVCGWFVCEKCGNCAPNCGGDDPINRRKRKRKTISNIYFNE